MEQKVQQEGFGYHIERHGTKKNFFKKKEKH